MCIPGNTGFFSARAFGALKCIVLPNKISNLKFMGGITLERPCT